MNNKKIIFGIGIALAVLAMLTASATADPNLVYFDPDPSCAAPGQEITVTMWLNSTAGVATWNTDIYFDLDVVNITSGAPGDFPTMFACIHKGNFVRVSGITSDWLDLPPGHWKMADLTFVANNTGTSEIHHVANYLYDWTGYPPANGETWIDGTFNCPCGSPTYTISGYTDPVAGTLSITNLDKSEVVNEIPADYIDPVTGFYNLTLNVSDEVEQDDILRITACAQTDEYESNCNVTFHTVMNAPGEDTNVNITLDHYCLDLKEFPMYEAEEVGTPADYNKGCGPAVSKMWLDYMHNSTTQWNDTHFGDRPAMNQEDLYSWGIGNNSNTSLPYFDTQGMWYTVQYLDPEPYSEYGYNFGKYSSTDQDYMVKQICKWLSYAPGKKPGHPVHVPGAVPAYGNYENWMAVRGIHTSEDAYPLPVDLLVYGLWVNDPYPASFGGIGENSYKTIAEWNLTYYLPLDVPGDGYDGKYVGILEPPGDVDCEITFVPAKARLTDVITPELIEKTQTVYDVDLPVLEKVIKDDEMLKIIAAATDGVNEELIPYDAEFAEVFAKTVSGAPMLVSSDNGDYYLVPFNAPVKSVSPVKEVPEVKKAPVKAKNIMTDGIVKAKYMDDPVILKPIPIDPIKLEGTVIVVIVDAEDGSFKEASWVANPVKYLPLSKVEALKLALGEEAITDSRKLKAHKLKLTIELVYQDKSPYYPAWEITIADEVYIISQDRTVSS